MKSEADVDYVSGRMVEAYYDGIKVVMVAWHTTITTTTYLHGTPHMLVGERCKDSMWAGSIIHPITGRQHVIVEGKKVRGSTKNIVIAVVHHHHHHHHHLFMHPVGATAARQHVRSRQAQRLVRVGTLRKQAAWWQ